MKSVTSEDSTCFHGYSHRRHKQIPMTESSSPAYTARPCRAENARLPSCTRQQRPMQPLLLTCALPVSRQQRLQPQDAEANGGSTTRLHLADGPQRRAHEPRHRSLRSDQPRHRRRPAAAVSEGGTSRPPWTACATCTACKRLKSAAALQTHEREWSCPVQPCELEWSCHAFALAQPGRIKQVKRGS